MELDVLLGILFLLVPDRLAPAGCGRTCSKNGGCDADSTTYSTSTNVFGMSARKTRSTGTLPTVTV